VNVKDYGAKGDGVSDDVNAFQAAEDFVAAKGGGTVYVPSGVYIVSQPFYHRSFVTLTGDGDNSIIRNNVVSPAGPGQFCIYIGNFSPSTYAQCVHYDGNSILAGSNQFQLTISSNAK
jgi:polygalacturonase